MRVIVGPIRKESGGYHERLVVRLSRKVHCSEARFRRYFPASCSAVRPRRRMKPGKFQQIGPKTSSNPRGTNGQTNQRSRLRGFCSSRAKSIREAVTQNSWDLALTDRRGKAVGRFG